MLTEQGTTFGQNDRVDLQLSSLPRQEASSWPTAEELAIQRAKAREAEFLNSAQGQLAQSGMFVTAIRKQHAALVDEPAQQFGADRGYEETN
jgi:hypothetical protein